MTTVFWIFVIINILGVVLLLLLWGLASYLHWRNHRRRVELYKKIRMSPAWLERQRRKEEDAR